MNPRAEQVPYVPKAPSLPDLPSGWDIELKQTFSVPVQVKLDTFNCRLDTGDFAIKYIAGIQSIGNTPASFHGKLPAELMKPIEDFCRQQIEKLYA